MNQTLPNWTVLGLTGHRNIADEAVIRTALDSILDRLQARQINIAAISSAAAGADTLFIESAARRGWPMFLILPFTRERFRQDFSPAGWKRVEPALAKAVHVEELAAMESDEEAYLEGGIRTAERCDVMIAVWDGQAARGVGGTAEIVAHARALRKPLICIDPATGATAEERMELLPAPATRPANDIRDWYAAVDDTFRSLDRDANDQARSARRLLRLVILLHLAASAIAVAPLALHMDSEGLFWTASAAKLTALVWALVAVLRHRRAHHVWLHSRAEAELCRAFRAIWRMERRSSTPELYWLPDGGRLGSDLRVAWFIDRAAALPLPQATANYHNDRVRDQLGYYESHRDRAGRWYRGLKRAANAMTIGAIVAAVATMVLHQHPHAEYWPKLLSIVLPLANAAILSLLVSNDIGRRSVRYEQVARRLHEVENRLKTVRTWPGLWRVVAQTESLLLAEVSEWHSFSRFGGEH